jgi:dolichol-phosphate mannosyltransferase
MKILTVVATYNEADNIARLIPAILMHAPASSVLIVDDNSPDGTADVVRALRRTDGRVDLICRTDRRGYGSAILEGIRYGITQGYEGIATLDADFSHDPADLPRLIDALASAEVAIGSRYINGIRVINWDVRRLLLSLAANAYIRSLSGLACVDCTSGFRAYNVNVLAPATLDRVTATGYAFLPELLFMLDDVTVAEIPICFTERRVGTSKMSARVIAEALVRPWSMLAWRLVRSVRRAFGLGRPPVQSRRRAGRTEDIT